MIFFILALINYLEIRKRKQIFTLYGIKAPCCKISNVNFCNFEWLKDTFVECKTCHRIFRIDL